MRQCVKAIMPWEGSNLSRYQLQCPVCGMICERDFWSISNISVEQVYYCECGNILILPPQQVDEAQSASASKI